MRHREPVQTENASMGFLNAAVLWCAHGALDDGWLTSNVRASCYGSSVKLGLIWC